MFATKSKGILEASLGASFFGISSVIAGILFKRCGVNPGWLVTVRMLFSGLLLLGWLTFKRKPIFIVWQSARSAIIVIAFGIFGVLFAQSSFLLSVFYGNAAIATILQSLGTSLMIIVLAVKFKRLPRTIELIALFLSLSGIFFLVTNGNIGELSFSSLALFWGILSAFGVCAYTLIPCSLIKRSPPLVIVAWGMLIGGIFSNILAPVTQIPIHFDRTDLFLVIIIILIGTLLAYSLYINSLKHIEPHIIGMLGMLEPVTAILISTLMLKMSFLTFQKLGIMLIFLSLFLINFPSKTKR